MLKETISIFKKEKNYQNFINIIFVGVTSVIITVLIFSNFLNENLLL